MLQKMLSELREIPQFATLCAQKNKDITLPREIDYLGMGASFYPQLALSYAGARFDPHPSSEYELYLSQKKKPLSVLISQSGKSVETVACGAFFDTYIAITNDPNSPLAKGKNVEKIIELHAGEEKAISSKTYVNTLVTLYQGFGFSINHEIKLLQKNITEYELWGKTKASILFKFFKKHQWKGIYILGAGPNLATAKEAALTMSEVTKLSVQGMSFGQYDHGPKETAAESAVIMLDVKGKSRKRAYQIHEKLKRTKNCLVIEYKDETQEITSPIHTIVPLNFLTFYLAELLGVKKVYEVGGKVVEAS